jgi:hypothetical protein
MQIYDRYWFTTLGRGILALLVSAVIAPLSHILGSSLRALVLFPLLLSVSIACLALYGLHDSVLVLATGVVLPKWRYAHWAFMLQGTTGTLVILLILWNPERLMSLQTLVALAAIQALCTAFADAITAVHAREHHAGTSSLLICSGISLLSALALIFGRSLPPADLANLICGYLLLLGATFLLLSIRMLSREGHLLYPVVQRLARRNRAAVPGTI